MQQQLLSQASKTAPSGCAPRRIYQWLHVLPITATMQENGQRDRTRPCSPSPSRSRSMPRHVRVGNHSHLASLHHTHQLHDHYCPCVERKDHRVDSVRDDRSYRARHWSMTIKLGTPSSPTAAKVAVPPATADQMRAADRITGDPAFWWDDCLRPEGRRGLHQWMLALEGGPRVRTIASTIPMCLALSLMRPTHRI